MPKILQILKERTTPIALVCLILGVILVANLGKLGAIDENLGATVLRAPQGGTGISSATTSDIGKALIVSSTNPFQYTLGTVASSGGGSTTTLTSTQVAYGSPDNTVTSSPNFTFNSSTNVLSVPSVSSTYTTSTNIAVPASQPYVVSTLTSSTIMAQSYSTFVSGNYVYMVSLVGDSLTVIDISNPAYPMIRGVFTSSTDLNGSRNVYVAGKYAYVANQDDDSLAIIDISNPSNPTFTGKVKNATDMDRTYFVNVAGQYAYVINNADNSMRIIDVSSSTAPRIVGGIKDNTNLAGAYGMNVNGRYAYVAAATDNSVRIIDVSNPASPTIVGGVKDNTLLSAVRAVAVSGRYAYATAFTGDTFAIIDVSDPTSPTIVSSITDSTNLNGVRSVTLQDNYAYVGASLNNSIAVIDISSSTNPRIVYTLKDDTNLNIPHGVYVAGNYLYAAMNTTTNPNFTVVGLNGLTAATGYIGALKVSNLNVQDDAVFNRNVVIQSGLNVGDRGILTSGNINGNGLTIYGTSSSTLIYTANLFFTSASGTTVTTTALVVGTDRVTDITGTGLQVNAGSLELTSAYQDGSAFDSRFVNIDGDTMTGGLKIYGETQDTPDSEGLFLGYSPEGTGRTKIELSGATESYIDFTDVGLDFEGRIHYDQTTSLLSFWANGGRAMHIDDSTLTVTNTSVLGSFTQTSFSDCDADNQTVSYDITTGVFGCGDDDIGVKYSLFSYTTTTAWSGTTTLYLGPADVSETWSSVRCETNTGTLNVQYYDGTNRMNVVNASSTANSVSLTTNNVFSAGESRRVDIGTPASSPTTIACKATYTIAL